MHGRAASSTTASTAGVSVDVEALNHIHKPRLCSHRLIEAGSAQPLLVLSWSSPLAEAPPARALSRAFVNAAASRTR
jgi:hypothetical protein